MTLEEEIQILRVALEQYADYTNWCYDTCNIGNDVAKNALEKIQNKRDLSILLKDLRNFIDPESLKPKERGKTTECVSLVERIDDALRGMK